MSRKIQFSLQTIMLAVSYCALATAWLAGRVFGLSDAPLRPGMLCVLSTAVALAAWPRRRGKYADSNWLLLITLATLLAAVGVIDQVIARLQVISVHGPIDWNWFRTEVGGTIVENLVWPLFALLPAIALYLNQCATPRTRVDTLLTGWLVLGIVSAAACIIVVAVLFRCGL